MISRRGLVSNPVSQPRELLVLPGDGPPRSADRRAAASRGSPPLGKSAP